MRIILGLYHSCAGAIWSSILTAPLRRDVLLNRQSLDTDVPNVVQKGVLDLR